MSSNNENKKTSMTMIEKSQWVCIVFICFIIIVMGVLVVAFYYDVQDTTAKIIDNSVESIDRIKRSLGQNKYNRENPYSPSYFQVNPQATMPQMSPYGAQQNMGNYGVQQNMGAYGAQQNMAQATSNPPQQQSF